MLYRNYRLPLSILGLTISALLLFGLLWQNSTYGSLINYSGLIRGGTQRVVTAELNGTPNDELIAYLDEVYYGLETGMSDLGIPKSNQSNYQAILCDVAELWDELKAEITLLRQDPTRSTDTLYQLSERHFQKADALTFCADENSAFTSTVLSTFR